MIPPSGVVLARRRRRTTPTQLPWELRSVTLLLCPRRLQRQHGPSGVVPVVVRSALTFSRLDIELWQDNNAYVLALLMTLMLSDCCGRLRGGGKVACAVMSASLNVMT